MISAALPVTITKPSPSPSKVYTVNSSPSRKPDSNSLFPDEIQIVITTGNCTSMSCEEKEFMIYACTKNAPNFRLGIRWLIQKPGNIADLRDLRGATQQAAGSSSENCIKLMTVKHGYAYLVQCSTV